MGILREPVQMIEALKLPKGFSVVELGDQFVTHSTPHRLAREWYREIGCGRYESIDSNGRGTINFDLNRKWGRPEEEFDLVTDFGTAEHIFNQAEVWRTIHRLAKVGGYIAFDKPTQGYPEHGFYNYHETFFRDVAATNGWRVLRLERKKTSRGELIRGLMQKKRAGTFAAPTQGRYRETFAAAAKGRKA